MQVTGYKPMLPHKRDMYGNVEIVSTPKRTPDISDIHSLESVLIASESNASPNPNSRRYNPQGYENALVCREFIGYELPPQTPDIMALREASLEMRQRTLTTRDKDAQRQKNKRHRDAVKAGRTVRSYKKRR